MEQVNSCWQALTFVVREGEPQKWFRVVDTSLATPEDICEPETERSTVVLVRK
jgi:pullulanase/glycogen debranching enzyme